MTKKTVGAIIAENAAKHHDPVHLLEYSEASMKAYHSDIQLCAQKDKNRYKGDFYVIGLFKEEKALLGTPLWKVFSRNTCPTPNYAQDVFLYDHQAQELKDIWTLPTRDWCKFIVKHAKYLPPHQYKLINYVLSFHDGSLFSKCQELNGEIPGTPFLKES